MKICLINIKRIPKCIYSYWFKLLSKESQCRINKKTNIQARKLSAVGEILAIKMIAFKSLKNFKDLRFIRNECKKPFIENTSYDFNISHSGNIVVCVISKKPIGIDIEIIKSVPFNLVFKVCSDEELEYIFCSDKEKSTFLTKKETIRFFKVWTSKEAYLKCIGIGINGNIKQVNSQYSNDFSKKQVNIFNRYIISICEKNNI